MSYAICASQQLNQCFCRKKANESIEHGELAFRSVSCSRVDAHEDDHHEDDHDEPTSTEHESAMDTDASEHNHAHHDSESGQESSSDQDRVMSMLHRLAAGAGITIGGFGMSGASSQMSTRCFLSRVDLNTRLETEADS
jgi:hypothetical protein